MDKRILLEQLIDARTAYRHFLASHNSIFMHGAVYQVQENLKTTQSSIDELTASIEPLGQPVIYQVDNTAAILSFNADNRFKITE